MKTNTIQQEMITINMLLLKYPNIKEYLFLNEQLRESPSYFLKESGHLSSGEQFLIKFSLDLWDGSGNALLRDVYKCLDRENYETVISILKLKFLGN